MPYYAIFVGREPGVYTSWTYAKTLIEKYPGAIYKSFNNKLDAENFALSGDIPTAPVFADNHSQIFKITKADSSSMMRPQPKMMRPQSHPKMIGSKIMQPNPDLVSTSLIDNINYYFEHYSQNDALYIYTDGSVKNNGKPYATGGYGVFFSDARIIPISNIIKLQNKPITTPISELLAIIEGLRKVYKFNEENGNPFKEIHLFTDSENCFKSLTKWYDGWVKNNWKTAYKKTGDVKNKEEIIIAHDFMIKTSAIITHIRAHTGKHDVHHLGNEIADQLTKCY